MATLSPIATLTDDGKTVVVDIDGSLAAAVDLSNNFLNDGNISIYVSNASGGNRVVTVKAQPDPFGRGGAGVGDVVCTIPAGKIGKLPFLNPASFNSGGQCTFTLDAVATTKIGIYREKKIR